MARTWIHRIIELFYRSAGEEARASFFLAAAVSTNALNYSGASPIASNSATSAVSTRTSTRAISKSGKNCLELSGERRDDSVRGSSCALHNAVPDILARLRCALRHVSCGVDGPRLNAANGDGERQNDRKEHFHRT